jgi:hypothetical protein
MAAQRLKPREEAHRVLHEALEPLHRLVRFADAARIGQLLIRALYVSRTIVLFHDAPHSDPGDAQDESAYHVTAQPESGDCRSVSRTSLQEALEALCGVERKKICPRCNDGRGTLKVLSEFPYNALREDGKGLYCRICERKRKKKYDQKRKRKGGDDAPT